MLGKILQTVRVALFGSSPPSAETPASATPSPASRSPVSQTPPRAMASTASQTAGGKQKDATSLRQSFVSARLADAPAQPPASLAGKSPANPPGENGAIADIASTPVDRRPKPHLDLQGLLDAASEGDRLQLWPESAEYAGPAVFRHGVALNGAGATLWAESGPTIAIEADEVYLQNLRVEVTGAVQADVRECCCAIWVKSGKNVRFRNVEVRGNVMGIPGEEGIWDYPSYLNLGNLASDREWEFYVRIVVPVACRLTSGIAGISLEPARLQPGKNEICVRLESLPRDTLLDGHFFLVTPTFKRRISLTAHILAQARATETKSLVWEAESWHEAEAAIAAFDDLQEEPEPLPEPSQEPEDLEAWEDIDFPDIDLSEALEPSASSFEFSEPLEPPEPTPEPTRELTQESLPSVQRDRPRIVRSQIVSNPLFETSVPVGAAPSEPAKPAKPSSAVNPLFQQSTPIEREEPVDEDLSPRSQPINPLFQQSSPTAPPRSLEEKSERRSPLTNPIFQTPEEEE